MSTFWDTLSYPTNFLAKEMPRIPNGMRVAWRHRDQRYGPYEGIVVDFVPKNTRMRDCWKKGLNRNAKGKYQVKVDRYVVDATPPGTDDVTYRCIPRAWWGWIILKGMAY